VFRAPEQAGTRLDGQVAAAEPVLVS
jgi:hypothetical protein